MVILFFFLAVLFDGIADAIDHGKGARSLGDLWHVFKRGAWVFLVVGSYEWGKIGWFRDFWGWIWGAGVLMALYVVWEVCYQWGRLHDVAAWDDKVSLWPLSILWRSRRWLR